MRDARNLTNSVHEKVPFLRMKLSQSFHEANRVFEQKRVQPVTDLHIGFSIKNIAKPNG